MSRRAETPESSTQSQTRSAAAPYHRRSPLIVAAHGFRSTGPSSPTHASVDDFHAWARQCHDRLGGFSHPDILLRTSAAPAGCLDRRNLPIDPPILTFDDALASVELVAERVPDRAILFVVVDHVGKRNDWPGQPGWVPRERCLDWSALRNLAGQGWRIGAHTMTHPRLRRLAPAAQRREIEASKKMIEDRLGLPCSFFAYPYGDAPASARGIVAGLGMIGFGMNPGRPGPKSDLACLPRVDLFDLVRPGIAAGWAWNGPRFGEVAALRSKRAIGRFRPRRSVA